MPLLVWSHWILVLATSPIGSPEMVPMSTPLTQAGFERIDTDAGVAVYQRTGAQNINIAAEGRLEGPPDQVLKVLLDYERHVGRVDRVSESKVLSRGDEHMMVYQRLNLPIIDDRDFYLSVRWGLEEGVRWIHYRSCLPSAPARPGIVRVHDHRGSWQLKPLQAGTATWARYQSNIDLSGLLPRWLARSNVGDEVPGLFIALRRMLAECDQNAR
jgi:hypothetical protein